MRGFVPVKIGPAWLVVEALHVQEVLGARPWVPIPHTSTNVPGVLAWRGRAVGVLDLARLTKAREPLRPGESCPRTLIVEARGCTLAMPVDAVQEVRELEDAQLRRLHATQLRHSSLEVELFGAVAPVLDIPSVVDGLLLEPGAHGG